MVLKTAIRFDDGCTQNMMFWKVNDFRLTTESGVPVSNSDRSGQGTLYLTPYKGDQIALLDGSDIAHLRDSAEVSLSLSGMTTNGIYDVWARWSSGAIVLDLSSAWANNITRTDALATVNGIRVKSGDHTRRIVGTIRASSSSGIEDTRANRWLCNFDNPVSKEVFINPNYSDNNNDTSYGSFSGSFQELAGGAATVTFLSQGTHAVLMMGCISSDASFGGSTGVAVDTQSTAYGSNSYSNRNNQSYPWCEYPVAGFHYFSLLSQGNASIFADGARMGQSFDPAMTFIMGSVWV